MLVLPSFDEGFGMPALEAMTVGRSGHRLEPRRTAGGGRRTRDCWWSRTMPPAIAAAIERVWSDDGPRADACRPMAFVRSYDFNWDWSARHLALAYVAALRERGGVA